MEAGFEWDWWRSGAAIGRRAHPFGDKLIPLYASPLQVTKTRIHQNGTTFMNRNSNKQSSPARKRTREATGNIPGSTPVPPSSPPLRDDDMAEVADEFEDDMDEVRDLEDMDDDVDGEDLFGDTMMRYRLSRVLTTGITESAPRRTFMIRRI